MRSMLGIACALALVFASARPASAALVTGAEEFRLSIPDYQRGQAQLSWGQAGPSTFGWFVIRYSEQAPRGELLRYPFLGDAIGLPSYITGTADVTPLVPGLTCYVLVPADANLAPLGHSDLLCKMNGFQSGLPPLLFGVQLGQTHTATVSWFYPVQGISGMVVVSSAGEIAGVGYPTNSVTFPIQAGTCYRGYALLDTAVVGTTDVVCAVPGQFEIVPDPPLAQLAETARSLGR